MIFRSEKKTSKKYQKRLAGIKKGCMFAAAKIAKVMSSEVLVRSVDITEELEVLKLRKIFQKKSIKTIVRLKKGFYICTRLTRKRVKIKREISS